MMTVAFGISLLAACGDNTVAPPFSGCDDPPTSCFDPLFESEVLRTKLEGCAGDPVLGGCHLVANPSTMELDLTDPATTVEAALSPLVGQSGLSGDPFIDAACVGDSVLLRKLTSDPGFGSRMPLTTNDWWSNDEVECFRAYLNDTFGQPATE
jgi:hypothetical protein